MSSAESKKSDEDKSDDEKFQRLINLSRDTFGLSKLLAPRIFSFPLSLSLSTGRSYNENLVASDISRYVKRKCEITERQKKGERKKEKEGEGTGGEEKGGGENLVLAS